MQRSLEVRVKVAVRRLAHTSGLSRRLARRETRVRVLAVHDVGGPRYPVAVFRRQMEYLAKHCRIIGIDDALAFARNGRPEFDRPRVALTFDDGLRSFGAVAVPILGELGIPASVFVCAGLVDGGGWIWSREARDRLSWLEAHQGGLDVPELGAPCDGTEPIIEWMRSLPLEERKRAESAIRARTPGFRIAEASHLGHDLMSWDELRALPADRVTVGSHTMTHPMLPTLEAEEQRWEMEESRRVLEDKVGRPVLHFAYPNGAADATTVAIAREIYASAWGAETGFVAPGADSHRLRRIAIPHSIDGLSWALHHP